MNTNSRQVPAFPRAAEFGFLLNLAHPNFPACRAKNSAFLPGALVSIGLAEQVENDYPALSCQRPNRCWLFQASLCKWIPSGLADRSWRSGILAWEQMLCFLAGHGAQARDYSKGENLPPAAVGPLQGAANSPTHSVAARYSLQGSGPDCPS